MPQPTKHSAKPHSESWVQAGWKTVAFAGLVIVIAIVHPAEGTGLPICFIHSTTGMPCPGCGMTRSMSCAARGMLEQSWMYHPFGIPFFALFMWIVAAGMLSRGTIRLWKPGYMAIVIAFVAFGAYRALMHFWAG